MPLLLETYCSFNPNNRIQGSDSGRALFEAIENNHLPSILYVLTQSTNKVETLQSNLIISIFFNDDYYGDEKLTPITPIELLIIHRASLEMIQKIEEDLESPQEKGLFLKDLITAASRNWRHRLHDSGMTVQTLKSEPIFEWALEHFLALRQGALEPHKKQGKNTSDPLASISNALKLPAPSDIELLSLRKRMVQHPEYVWADLPGNRAEYATSLLEAAFLEAKKIDEHLTHQVLKHYADGFNKEILIQSLKEKKRFDDAILLSSPMEAYQILAGKDDLVNQKLKELTKTLKEQKELKKQRDSLGFAENGKSDTRLILKTEPAYQAQMQKLDKITSAKNQQWIHHASYPFGWTPLAAAINQNKWELVDALVQHGASIEVKVAWSDLEHQTEPLPLITLMALSNNTESVRWLLQKGVSVEILNERFNHPKWGRVNALSVAALEGREDMVDLLLQVGVKPNVFSGSHLKLISQKYPYLRQKLGPQSVMESFSAHFERYTTFFTSKKQVLDKASSSGTSKASLNALQPEADHVENEALLEENLNSSNLSSSLERVKRQIKALNLPDEIENFCQGEIQKAGKLTNLGSLPVQGDDLSALQRMIQTNIPLLIKKISAIPVEDRDFTPEEGGLSSLQMFHQSFIAISETLKLMKQRALLKAHRGLEVEATVLHDQAKLALDRFTDHVASQAERAKLAEKAAPEVQEVKANAKASLL